MISKVEQVYSYERFEGRIHRHPRKADFEMVLSKLRHAASLSDSETLNPTIKHIVQKNTSVWGLFA